MKRTRFDSEYDKVRKRAGFARPHYDFDQLDRPAPTEEARRVAESNADFQEKIAEINRVDAMQSEATLKSHAENRRRWDERMIRREWEEAGLAPPNPLYSIGLALRLGCRVEEVGGEMVLVRPKRPTATGKKRDDYGNTEGS